MPTKAKITPKSKRSSKVGKSAKATPSAISTPRKLPLLSPRRKRLLIVFLIFALLGVYLIMRSLAANNPNLGGDLNGDNKVSIADLSILLTNFGKTTDAADLTGDGKVTVSDLSIILSNFGKTYTPGTPPPPPPTNPPPAVPPLATPTDLEAVTGGNNIALLWSLPEGITKVEVYRNDTLIGTVTKGQGIVRGDKIGTRFIDKTIVKGTNYQYKIRAVNDSGNSSPYTSTVSARPPTSTSPVPTVTINNPSNADLNDYLNNSAIPEIQTWYPKIGDAIAYPDYTPRNTITIFLDPAYTGLAEASFSTGQIRVNPTWLRNNPEDAGGMFVHEATHILQAYPGSQPGYITEGIADWTRDWFSRERPNHKPSATAKLTDGYSEGAYMLQWVETKYSPGIIRKVNIAAHNGQYSDSIISQAAGGKTPEQLYAEAKAANF